VLLARRVFVDARGFPILSYPDTFDAGRILAERDLANRCMRDRGYELLPVAPPARTRNDE